MGKYRGNTKFEDGSKVTDLVCDELGWGYCNGLKTMGKAGIVYVRGTLLKPDEARDLRRVDGMIVDGKKCKLMNFKN